MCLPVHGYASDKLCRGHFFLLYGIIYRMISETEDNT